MLKKIVYLIFPERVYSKLRTFYLSNKNKLFGKITYSGMKKILESKMGITRGNTVFIHNSMDFLNIDFGASKLLNLLLEIVGEEGTLIFPAWHFNYRAENYLQDDLIFDVKRSPSAMGLLSEFARRNPQALRSIHPTTSIVAIGKHAAEIVADHHKSVYPCGELSPYYKMMKYHAKIVGLGVSSHFVSFVHCVEDVMKDGFPIKTRTGTIFDGKVKLLDGQVIVVKTLAASTGISKRNIPRFMKKYISKKAFHSFSCKGNDFYIADSEKLFSEISDLAHKGITIYNI